MRLHGDSAYETARQTARAARDKKKRIEARFYTQVSLRVAELTGREVGLDTTTRMSGRPT